MLEANTSLLDDETSAIIAKIFGGDRVINAKYVPMRNESFKEALCLLGLEANRSIETPDATPCDLGEVESMTAVSGHRVRDREDPDLP